VLQLRLDDVHAVAADHEEAAPVVEFSAKYSVFAGFPFALHDMLIAVPESAEAVGALGAFAYVYVLDVLEMALFPALSVTVTL
jgi:hypothetical protein